MRIAASMFAALVLSGCYVTVPLANPHPDPGTKLRVQLTDAGTDQLARYLGPGVITVDGRLVQNSDSALALSVTQVSMRSGQDQFWKGETVNLPRTAISTVQERKLSRVRSLIIAGGVIAIAATLKVSGAISGGNSGHGTPSPQ